MTTEAAVVRMYGTDATLLVEVLEEAEARYKALAALTFTSAAEQQVLLKAAVVQSAVLQLEGATFPSATPGAIDWAVDVAMSGNTEQEGE